MNISNKLLQVKEVHKTFGEGQSETVALKGDKNEKRLIWMQLCQGII